MGLLQLVIERWVAGETLESAVLAGRRLNRIGIGALLNYIGEHHKNKILVERSVGMYLEALEAIRTEGLDASLSLKLTEIGLDIGKGYCFWNLLQLAQRAKELGVIVWIDMEDSHYIQNTIDIYLDVFKETQILGITLQANMRRTRKDLLKILGRRGRVRLVKGAYEGDYHEWDEIELNYSRLLRILFSRGNHFAVGTHDEVLLEEAGILQGRYQREFSFQFLRGVKRKVRRRMAREGYSIGEYTPFGKQVLPYVWRRWKEHGFAMVL